MENITDTQSSGTREEKKLCKKLYNHVAREACMQLVHGHTAPLMASLLCVLYGGKGLSMIPL